MCHVPPDPERAPHMKHVAILIHIFFDFTNIWVDLNYIYLLHLIHKYRSYKRSGLFYQIYCFCGSQH